MFSSKMKPQQQLVSRKQQNSDPSGTHNVFFKREMEDIYESRRNEDSRSKNYSANQLKDDVRRLERLLDKYDRFDMYKAFLQQCQKEDFIPSDMQNTINPPDLAKSDKQFMIGWQLRLHEFSKIVMKDIIHHCNETITKITKHINSLSGRLKNTLPSQDFHMIIEAVTELQKHRLDRLAAENERNLKQLRYKSYSKKSPQTHQKYATICYGVDEPDKDENDKTQICKENGKLVLYKDPQLVSPQVINKTRINNIGTEARMKNRNKDRKLQAVKDQILQKELREGIKERKIIPITKVDSEPESISESNNGVESPQIREKIAKEGLSSKENVTHKALEELKRGFEEKLKCHASEDFEDKLGLDYIEDQDDEYDTNIHACHDFLESLTSTLPGTIEYFERRFNHENGM